MIDAHEFLKNLALVLCVAAATALVFQRLKQPVVFGYLVAGMLVGPHIPVPLVADEAMVRTLSELGVVLVMFSLGLEFSIRQLFKVGPTSGLVALIECSAMLWLGFTAGQLFGWSTRESIFAGAIVAISSTTILVKTFKELGIRGKVTEVVFGVLVFEDLIAILLLALLTALSGGGEVSLAGVGATAGRLGVFLVGLAGVGFLVVPRLVRYVVKLNSPELTLVTSVGICFAFALLALSFGYSVALGAFLAGSLVAESGQEKSVLHLVEPVRDLFAAIFFVSVGMLIDPALVLQHWVPVLVFTVLVVVGKTTFVSLGAFFAGFNTSTSVRAGMSLAQIGEFSFIIAGVGVVNGADDVPLYTVAVAVSALTSLGTPWMVRASGSAAYFLDRKLPKRMQNFASLYGSWIEGVRAPGQVVPTKMDPVVKRHIRSLAIDAALLIALVIGTHLEVAQLTALLAKATNIDPTWTRVLVLAGAGALAVPVLTVLVNNARSLGALLANRALPPVQKGRLDHAATPRRTLVVVLQIFVLAVTGAPIIVITQPFVPVLGSAAVMAVLLLLFAFLFWRRATDLYGHTKAGAEIIVMALAQHAAADGEEEAEKNAVGQLHAVIPGLGEPVPIRLMLGSRAVGRTLKSLNLRGRTGATVLAIRREGGDTLLVPTGNEVLQAGDILALAGSHDSIEQARRKLGDHRVTRAFPVQSE